MATKGKVIMSVYINPTIKRQLAAAAKKRFQSLSALVEQILTEYEHRQKTGGLKDDQEESRPA